MSRNKITRDLHSPKYRQRVVRSKKAYSRRWKMEDDMRTHTYHGLASALAFLLEQVYQMEKMFPDDEALRDAISDAEGALEAYRRERER